MKRYLFSLFLALVFLVGVLGHLYAHADPPKEVPYAITLKVDRADGLLLYALPETGARLTLLGKEATLLSVAHTPTRLYERREGVLVSYPSALVFSLTLRVKMDAHERDGRIYFGEKQVALGDELSLGGKNFSIRARFTEISAYF